MNTWFIASIMAPLLWGFTNPIDAAIRRSFIKSDLAMTWIFLFVRLLIVIPIFIFAGFNIVPSWELLGLFLAGVVWALPIVLYFRALEIEETSRVVLLIQLSPIFVFTFAAIFLGETLSFNQSIAFLFILLGGAIAAMHRFEGKWKFSKAFWLIMMANTLWAIGDVAFKAFEPSAGSFQLALLIYFGAGGTLSLVLMASRKRFRHIKSHLSGLSARAWGMIASTHVISMAAFTLFYLAITMGKASLTGVLLGVQPLFAFIFTILLIRFIKEIPKEDLSRGNIITKISSLTLILVGLLYLAA